MADVKEPEVSSSLEDNANDETTLVRRYWWIEQFEEADMAYGCF
jgi:hypothetical protein